MSAEPESTFALLTPLVHYLSAAESVTVAEAAAHFEVSTDRIREAVQLLWMTGVPNTWGDPTMFDFDFDAYEQDDRIEIRYLPALAEESVRLSTREGAALLAGLARLQQLAPGDADRIESLARRIREATAFGRITVGARSEPADAVLVVVREAIERGCALRFEYRKPGDEAETRMIIPISLEMADQSTLVTGLDLDRRAQRSFRVDRMDAPALFDRPDDAPAAAEAEPVGTDSLTVHATEAAAIALAPYVALSEPATDGGRMLQIEVWELEPVLRAIMATGGQARVLRPPAAVAAMARLAGTALR